MRRPLLHPVWKENRYDASSSRNEASSGTGRSSARRRCAERARLTTLRFRSFSKQSQRSRRRRKLLSLFPPTHHERYGETRTFWSGVPVRNIPRPGPL